VGVESKNFVKFCFRVDANYCTVPGFRRDDVGRAAVFR
jgi:hypothetical protein